MILGFASGSDRHKPDSTLTANNGDVMKFATGATIQTTPLLAPGSTKIRCDLSVSKQNAEAVLSLIATSTDEYCVTLIVTQTAASTINTHTWIRAGIAGGAGTTGFNFYTILSGGVTVWRFKYDTTQIGADFTPTLNRTYRVGIYLKLGTLSVANSTVKIYIDDVTTVADIAVGGATLVIGSTTVTMANAPGIAALTIGAQANIAVGGSGSIFEFQHIVVLDSSGSSNNVPASRVLDPICVTDRSVPIGAGNYAEQSTGTFADVDDLPPDDATTMVTGVMTAVNSVRRVSFDMTPWATVGGSAKASLIAVRNIWRASASSANVQFETLLRTGSTDSYFNIIATGTPWVTYATAIRETNPSTSTGWTVADYDAAEAGGRFTRFGADLTGRTTLVGLDAVFIRPVVMQRAYKLNQAVNRAAVI